MLKNISKLCLAFSGGEVGLLLVGVFKKSLLYKRKKAFEFTYPAPESNRHGFPQVFETSASTNSASWAC